MFQQGTEKSIFKVIFKIEFGIMTTTILQNTISRFNLFLIESFDSGVRVRLWHYDCNDSANTISEISFFQIESVDS